MRETLNMKNTKTIYAFLPPLLVFLPQTYCLLSSYYHIYWLHIVSMESFVSQSYIYGSLSQFLMDLFPIILLIRSGEDLFGNRQDQKKAIIVGVIGASILVLIKFAIRGLIESDDRRVST